MRGYLMHDLIQTKEVFVKWWNKNHLEKMFSFLHEIDRFRKLILILRDSDHWEGYGCLSKAHYTMSIFENNIAM